MSITALHNPALACWRRFGAWRRRTRPGRAIDMLALVLAVGLGEPLLCIVHCQLWLPLAFSHYFAAQHTHHHTPGMPMPGMGAQAITAGTGATTPESGCFVRGTSGAEVPFHVPPSPVHEMLPALGGALLLASLVRRFTAIPPRAPPLLAFPPPLRPPRLPAL